MKRLLAASLMTCLATIGHAAETRLKPGQWEITSQSDMGGVKVQMPKLTPQQIAQMEKAGVKIPTTAPGGGIVVKSCITKEQSERNEIPKPRDNDRQKCEQTEMKRSGNTVNWKVVCSGERPMTGSGSMTIHSPEAYSGNSTFTSKDPKGGDMTFNSSVQGKWISAVCETPIAKK